MRFKRRTDDVAVMAGEALGKRERFAQQIVDMCPSMIYVFDLRGRKTIFVNRGILAVLGYFTKPEVREPGFIRSVMHPDDWQRFLDHLERLARLSDQETDKFECRMRHSSGNWRWFQSLDKVFSRNEDGSVREIIGTAADVTERKAAEEKFRFMNELNQALLPIGDPKQIMAVTVRMVGEYLGVDRCGYAEVQADNDTFVVMGDYTRGSTSSIVGRYRMSDFGDRECQVLRQNRTYVVNDIEAESPPGKDLSLYRQAQIRALMSVPLNKAGRFIARMAVQQNTPRHWTPEEIELLTMVADRCWESVERVRTLNMLRASEERFGKAFRISPDGLVISRLADGVILELNDSFVSMTGYDRVELMGRSTVLLGLYVDPADRQYAVTMLKEQGFVRDFEFPMKRKSGEVRMMSFSADPLELDGIPCWLTVARDITEHKQFEKEREQLLQQEKSAREEAEGANRMKDEFLATVSHELRTPLTSILGWTHLLSEDVISQSQGKRGLEVIRKNAQAQARLIDDILDMSRIITGRLKLEVHPLAIGPVFAAVVDIIRPSAEAKRIVLRVSIEDGNSLILGDPTRLQQVFWNLLSNAIKFTNDGGLVEARLIRVEDQIEISIRDTGVGIERQFLPHLFNRFSQADSTSTRRYGGLGLGLAIVRHVVEMLGGSVSASSEGKGHGATFLVRFPVALVPSLRGPLTLQTKFPAETSDRQTPRKEGRELEGIEALVVDDDLDTLEMLRFVLVASGAAVITASSTAEALAVMKESRPDVLVSDLAMPDQDGYDLIQQVRSRSPEQGGSIPAVALTAYVRPEDRVRSLAAGFQMHVPKPVDPEELVAVVSSLIRRLPPIRH